MSNRKHHRREQSGTEEQLWQYVSGHLAPDQQHALEAEKVDDPFWNDAIEGLQQIEDKQQIKKMTSRLQQQLHHSIKPVRKRKGIGHMQPVFVTILLLLLLILSYLVFHSYLSKP